MKIPKTMKVGRRRYNIKQVPTLPRHDNGYIWPLRREILLSTQSSHGRDRPAELVAETFWHETTHAILYDMGHSLWKNEEFVRRFSKRLHGAIASATF